MPLNDGIEFAYGDYVFDPRPLFTINKEIIKTASNDALATKYSLNLQGYILPTGIDPIDNNKGGLSKVFSGMDSLRDAFNKDHKLLRIQCIDPDTGDEEAPIVSGYPKVVSLDFTNAGDNYIRRADYTINLELPSITGSGGYDTHGIDCDDELVGGTDLTTHGITSVTDDLTIEFLDERMGVNEDLMFGNSDRGYYSLGKFPSVYSIQRSLTAVGDSLYCGDGEYTTPVQRASNYLSGVLTGLPLSGIAGGSLGAGQSGLETLMCSGANIYNQFRSVSVNPYEGSVSVNISMIALDSEQSGYEDFDISADRSIDSPFTTISINGTVQGLVPFRDECSGVPKISGALAKFSGDVSGAIYSRAAAIYDGGYGPRIQVEHGQGMPPGGALNPEPLSNNIGYNITEGTVVYNYTYDDRPVNCYTGALVETIRFTYNNPNDVFASLTILGKPRGPLYQQIGTSGTMTREISIDAVIPVAINSGWSVASDFILAPSGYDELVNDYQGYLATQYDQVFVNSESRSWEPKMGAFSYTKSWTVGYCF